MVSTQTDIPAELGQAVDVSAITKSFLGASDHKSVGRFYIGSGALVLVAAMLAAAVAVFEATDLATFTILDDNDQFIQVWSVAREGIVFGAVLPLLVGLALYLVPLQTGIPGIAFVRGVTASFWTWLFGVFLLVAAYLMNGGPGGGRQDFVALWVLALAMMIGGLAWAMVCTATTLIGTRARGMSLDRAPYTSWGFLVFSVVGVLVLAAVLVELFVSYIRVRYGAVSLSRSEELLSVSSAAFRAPGVFWLASPILGIGADIIGVHTDKPVRRNKPIMMLIGLFVSLAFISGLSGFSSIESQEVSEVLLVGLVVMLLAGLGVLILSAESLVKGKRSFNPALAGVMVSGLLLLLAIDIAIIDAFGSVVTSVDFNPVGVTGSLEVNNLQSLLNLEGLTFYGSAFALAIGSALVCILAAVHHWSLKLWGRQLNASLSFVSIALAAGGSALWGISQFVASLQQDPNALQSASLSSNIELYNFGSFIGVVAFGLAGVLLLLNVASLSSNKVVGSTSNSWQGLTLEWATASPPSRKNFSQAPVVRSAFPLIEGVLPDEPETNKALEGETQKALGTGSGE